MKRESMRIALYGKVKDVALELAKKKGITPTAVVMELIMNAQDATENKNNDKPE
ncbi:hypothetical protein ACM65P_002634 [Vibrio alginolyticus]